MVPQNGRTEGVESSDSTISSPVNSRKNLLSIHNKEKMTEHNADDKEVKLKREVGLAGGISLIVGTMIGSGIFVSPTGVFRLTGSVGIGLLTWFGCGVLATFGALSYAEVGTMIPKSGGEFPILLEAFGPIPAYMFAWTSVTVLKPSSLAILSLTFAKYALSAFYPVGCVPPDFAMKLVALMVIGIVVFINCASVKWSTKFLTAFSFGKILSLAIIIVAGFVALFKGGTASFESSFDAPPLGPREIALAFYQGLWAFDGWNQLNYVIEELKNPYVNLPRAIITAMVLVTSLYLMTNVAYLSVLSFHEMLTVPAVGNAFGAQMLGVMAWIIPLAVTWSVFGTCLGSCFTAGRIAYVASREGQFNVVLSMIHVKKLTPSPSVLLNGIFAVIMVIPNDFDTLIDYFSFCMWMFHGGTCAALLYFRWKEPNRHRPVKVPIFIPIVVVVAAIALVLIPIIDNPQVHYLFVIIYMASGLIFYIPFVHYKKRSKTIEHMNIFLQKLLQVVAAEEEGGEKN